MGRTFRFLTLGCVFSVSPVAAAADILDDIDLYVGLGAGMTSIEADTALTATPLVFPTYVYPSGQTPGQTFNQNLSGAVVGLSVFGGVQFDDGPVVVRA